MGKKECYSLKIPQVNKINQIQDVSKGRLKHVYHGQMPPLPGSWRRVPCQMLRACRTSWTSCVSADRNHGDRGGRATSPTLPIQRLGCMLSRYSRTV